VGAGEERAGSNGRGDPGSVGSKLCAAHCGATPEVCERIIQKHPSGRRPVAVDAFAAHPLPVGEEIPLLQLPAGADNHS
jgi:hypothetical protein